jgi:hypothetical protein
MSMRVMSMRVMNINMRVIQSFTHSQKKIWTPVVQRSRHYTFEVTLR